MATDLVGNETLQRFIGLLARLNRLSADALKTGELKTIGELNGVVVEMHAIQSVGKEDAYTGIEDDAQVIYKNTDAITAMLQSCDGKLDAVTSGAVKKFLRNVFDATVRIIYAYGLA